MVGLCILQQEVQRGARFPEGKNKRTRAVLASMLVGETKNSNVDKLTLYAWRRIDQSKQGATEKKEQRLQHTSTIPWFTMTAY
nr:hypothetical protein CFP56_13477 [Quercus suber]